MSWSGLVFDRSICVRPRPCTHVVQSSPVHVAWEEEWDVTRQLTWAMHAWLISHCFRRIWLLLNCHFLGPYSSAVWLYMLSALIRLGRVTGPIICWFYTDRMKCNAKWFSCGWWKRYTARSLCFEEQVEQVRRHASSWTLIRMRKRKENKQTSVTKVKAWSIRLSIMLQARHLQPNPGLLFDGLLPKPPKVEGPTKLVDVNNF